MSEKDRWDEIKDIWKENSWLWLVPGLVFGCVIGFLLGISSTADADDWFLSGIWPEAVSTVVTIVFIYQFDRWRNERYENKREENQLKEKLLDQVRSPSRDIAVNALSVMNLKGWLKSEPGPLRGIKFDYPLIPQWSEADLTRVDLRGSSLIGANLEKAHLWKVNLEESTLTGAKLIEATMSFAILRGSHMTNVDLSRAGLEGANMMFCDLYGANFNNAYCGLVCLDVTDMRMIKAQSTHFNGASMFMAQLAGADLTNAWLFASDLRFTTWTDETHGPAILPNGDSYQTDEDLLKFTNPHHPEFWIPEWVRRQRRDDAVEHFKNTKPLSDDRLPKLFEDFWLPSWIKGADREKLEMLYRETKANYTS